VTTGVKDSAGNAIASEEKWSFSTKAAVVATPADTTPPTIASRIPDKDAPNIDSNTPVKIVFTENMLESTINGNTIKLLNDVGAEVEGTTVSLDQSDKKAVTITHRPLEKGKKYTIKVTTGVKDSAGNAIASEEKWSFSTKAAVVATPADTTPPTIASRIPDKDAPNI